MVYASEDLIKEHKGIIFALGILELMTESIRSKEPVDIDDLKDMVEFLKLFADKCHHGKEENLMFPAMIQAGIKNENGPVGQMLLEHAEGRKHISGMSGAIDNGILDESSFAQAASDYIELLRQHINKENTVLFPMGDKLIPPAEQERLLIQFEEFEEQVMGKGTHERLHELLEQLELKYL